MTASDWQLRMDAALAGRNPAEREKLSEALVTETEVVSGPDDFRRWIGELPGNWCFRGQRDADWLLTTTLDRAVTQTIISDERTTLTGKLDYRPYEKRLLLDFQRGAHQYYSVTPAADDVVDWLALLQHHGAPTRLLDWTESPYVALYFALREASQRRIPQFGR